MLTNEERVAHEAATEENFEKYKEAKAAGKFRWFYRYHNEWLKHKRLLILDDIAKISFNADLTPTQAINQIDALIDVYEETLKELP